MHDKGRSRGSALLVGATILGLAALALGYDGEAVQGGGAIRGTVRLTGAAPNLPAAKVPAQHHGACGHNVINEEAVTGTNGALANVIVSIDGIGRGAVAAQKRVTVDQRNCRYVPHVQATTVGSQLTITSNDATLHNIHAYSGTDTLFNIAMPIKGMRINRTLDAPGPVELKCDAGHTWMRAFIHVFDHPYFAVTANDGAFEMRDVPPGRHSVKAWHERFGVRTGTVDVSSGGTATWNVSFSP